MRTLSGLTGIDRHAPADYLNTPEEFYRESKRLIGRYHRKGRNLYAITPRYAMGASPELLEACRRLKREHPDCWVNTHISETPDEVRGVKAEHPECADYLGVYEKYELVGPKFSGGHGIWLSKASSAAWPTRARRSSSAPARTCSSAAACSASAAPPIRDRA
jgi:guanine deaminase